MEFLLLIMAILLYVLDSSQESEEKEDENVKCENRQFARKKLLIRRKKRCN
jgi:hypothetical protein